GFGLIQADAALASLHSLTVTSGAGGTPNPVASGGIVSVSVAAVDSLSYALTYSWVASCPALGSDGAFSNPAAQTSAGTAPFNGTGATQVCTLAVLIGDGHSREAASSYSQAVMASAFPILSLHLNQTLFHPGDTMVLTVTLVPGLTSPLLDAYIVLQLPDGSFVSLQPVGAVPGIAPIARGFTAIPFSGVVLSYRFTGAEPRGPYSWFAALTQAGTATLVGPFQQLPFTLSP